MVALSVRSPICATQKNPMTNASSPQRVSTFKASPSTGPYTIQDMRVKKNLSRPEMGTSGLRSSQSSRGVYMRAVLGFVLVIVVLWFVYGRRLGGENL